MARRPEEVDGFANDVEALLDDLRERFPDSEAQIEVTARCGRELAPLLRGEADPLAMIFPGGQLDLAEKLYRGTPEARVYNTLIKDAVVGLADAQPDGERLRIVELGAGTGGVTSFIVPALPAERVAEYRFTDLSPVFLNRAREAFGDRPFMDFGICNIEDDPTTQGLDAGGYDIAIAVNMIHATADLRRSLTNARKLLKPGGLLILMEGTGPDRWVDITFGLTDGWWYFTDRDVRADYPLLDRDRWERLLADVGFEQPVTAPPAHDRSFQSIVVARKPVQTAADDDGAGSAWLLLDDEQGIAAGVADRLRARGKRVVHVGRGDAYARGDGDRFTVRADAPEDLDAVMADAFGEGVTSLEGAVHLWAIDAASPVAVSAAGEAVVDDEASRLDTIERVATGGSVALLQALASAGLSTVPDVTLVTRGAQPVEAGWVDPTAAPLWGLGKVVDLEWKDSTCRRVDLDPAVAPDAAADALVEELLAADRETLVARRGSDRHVGRLSRIALEDGEAPAAAGSPTRLVHDGSGVLDDLRREPMERRSPEGGDVEIEVAASGLSFRDVMNALAMRDDPDPLGAECTGVVTRVGAEVTDLQVGDRVVALTAGAFDSFVTVARPLVAPLPATLSFEQGATVGTAFTTAWYSLVDLGKLNEGESVLIHAGTGGVGMAAVQIALTRGARVLATAGSPAKRHLLRQLGVSHVFDSRSTTFTQEALDATDGRGVDAVLNSLSGEFIEASVAALAEEGRFLEIGKRDLWTQERFAEARPQGRYEIIDLAAKTVEDPSLMGRLLTTVTSELAEGRLRPLPFQAFERAKTSDAFRAMSQARQVGKLVVRHPAAGELRVREDGSYLLTGGNNGLGLLTARWLVECGARHVMLLSRSEPGDEAREAIAEMESHGAQVQTAAVDVSDAAALEEAINRLERAGAPLAGVFHAAGLLRDAVILNQDWDQFQPVFDAKVLGAWNLHRIVGHRPLDYFVMYSSTSAILGAAGQANHAASNAYLDALAHHRRRLGLTAQSINWGVWSQVGSAAARGADERILAHGASAIAPDQGLDALERCLRDGRPQVVVVPVHWKRFLPNFVGADPAPYWSHVDVRVADDPAGAGDAPTLMPEAPTADSATPPRTPGSDLGELLEAPPARRRELLIERVTDDVVTVIGLAPGRSVDPDQPLSEMGLDSLMAVELRNRLGSSFGLAALPATLVFDYPTIDALAGLVDERLGGSPADGALAAEAEAEPEEDADDLLKAIEEMSDDEVDSILKD